METEKINIGGMELEYIPTHRTRWEKLFWNIEFHIWFRPKMAIRDFFYNISDGFKAVRRFGRLVWTWRDFDPYYTVALFQEGLRGLETGLIHEVDGPREKRKAAIRELNAVIDSLIDDEEEDRLICDAVNKKITFKKATAAIYKERLKKYKRAYTLIVGQDPAKHEDENFDDWFDGSGIEGWTD